ncbi:probable E3 ubiquitin-protein ligase TRIM8 isoform X1 [Poecilia latipinna]|uniref:Tripartite motif containing 25, like n=2 Tax=Poecilia latipinna TaxID=48699 RepID=A0A3B3VLR3_9TELE|nr:PREDICTED: probable E3 ubiquitin-protein ligase TRIM8 isoform X1 [Poecilia latipinna]XP_014915421.1 PREDICTED: probable E3 ubiquitin-protein ligase TRIM8 isoform X1 [Poecilia latipinna]XP_014915422.1 PREDICTED: probable E3 ubiquitin-protein ligase TRIM8 isoform X1 [Poecilia latipinna]
MSGKLWTEEQFNCPVCLDLPNDPVTIPCGHSYCMACIGDFWSKDDPKGIYSCPQCRQTFCPKPPLSRNTMLAEAVEQLRKGALTSEVRDSIRSARGLSSRSKSRLSTGAVLCDMCKGEQRAAVKSCLACMSSFCETHLKPHQTKKSLKQHELIPPTSNLAEKICTQHKYLQEFFCRQCKMFVCWLCTSNQHKDHECVSTKAERQERQKLLSDIQADNQQKLKHREQELKDMKKMMEGVKRSADRVHDETENILGELLRSVERLQELLEEVLDQASLGKMNQAQEVADNLEAEIRERRKRDSEMRDLVDCADNIYYLQTCDTMCSPLECGDLPAVQVNHSATFEPVREAVLALRDRVEDLCNQELGKINKQVNETKLFTLGNSSRLGGKKGFRDLFSGLNKNNTDNRTPTSTITLDVRSTGRQGPALGGADVRSRDAPRDRGSTNSPRMGNRRRREEREAERDSNPSPTPSRRGGPSLWSRSSQNPVAPPAAMTPTPIPATPTPTPVPAPSPASSGAFSRMASITSLFRSHRRGANQATPVNNIAAAGGNPGGMADLLETPTEINPGLFLDTPLPNAMTQAPAFPALREISLDSIQAPEPRSREEFLQYSVILTLDPYTAHKRLVLSEGNTKATLQGPTQPYADTPQRFDGWTQVMCQSPLQAQRSYWEVEWRGRGSSVGVAYGSLSRKGNDARSGLGYNAQSWTLELSDTCCSAMHANEKRDIPVTYSPRLGVYADLSAGMLSFYSVADNMMHLHSFRANFTQPIYATFGVGCGVGVGLDFALGQFSSSSDSIKICTL